MPGEIDGDVVARNGQAGAARDAGQIACQNNFGRNVDGFRELTEKNLDEITRDDGVVVGVTPNCVVADGVALAVNVETAAVVRKMIAFDAIVVIGRMNTGAFPTTDAILRGSATSHDRFVLEANSIAAVTPRGAILHRAATAKIKSHPGRTRKGGSSRNIAPGTAIRQGAAICRVNSS